MSKIQFTLLELTFIRTALLTEIIDTQRYADDNTIPQQQRDWFNVRLRVLNETVSKLDKILHS